MEETIPKSVVNCNASFFVWMCVYTGRYLLSIFSSWAWATPLQRWLQQSLIWPQSSPSWLLSLSGQFLIDIYLQATNCSSRLKLVTQVRNSRCEEHGGAGEDHRNTGVCRWRDTAEPVQGCGPDSPSIFDPRTRRKWHNRHQWQQNEMVAGLGVAAAELHHLRILDAAAREAHQGVPCSHLQHCIHGLVQLTASRGTGTHHPKAPLSLAAPRKYTDCNYSFRGT